MKVFLILNQIYPSVAGNYDQPVVLRNWYSRGIDTVSSQLNLFLDDMGIWHCGGRQQNAE